MISFFQHDSLQEGVRTKGHTLYIHTCLALNCMKHHYAGMHTCTRTHTHTHTHAHPKTHIHIRILTKNDTNTVGCNHIGCNKHIYEHEI